MSAQKPPFGAFIIGSVIAVAVGVGQTWLAIAAAGAPPPIEALIVSILAMIAAQLTALALAQASIWLAVALVGAVTVCVLKVLLLAPWDAVAVLCLVPAFLQATVYCLLAALARSGAEDQSQVVIWQSREPVPAELSTLCRPAGQADEEALLRWIAECRKE